MADFDDNAKSVLEHRYLARDRKGNIIETPDKMLERVAGSIVDVEKDKEYWFDRFHGIMDSLSFLPNSPCLINAGRDLGQLSACFVLPVSDSIEHIFEMAKQSALIHKTGGGTGFNFSSLRPNGAAVRSTGGIASGPIQFLRAFDVVTDVIKQGGVRRGANMGILNCTHPDVMDFIDCKNDTGLYNNFNISVGLVNSFMSMVESDDYMQLHFRGFPYKEKIKPKDIFNKICENAWKTGEPGILFLDTINQHNPTPWLGKIYATNPCITGDTQISVADGRCKVPIKQLVDEGKDVPVYTRNDNNRIAIRMMRNPRKTGTSVPVYSVKLDNGNRLRVTSEHEFVLSNGEVKKATDLGPGDSLFVMERHKASFNEIIENVESGSEYLWLRGSCDRSFVPEHRMIASVEDNMVIHHINGNRLDNSPSNLDIMMKEDHDYMHSKSMLGDGNPVNRFPDRNIFNDYEWQRQNSVKHHIGAKRPEKACRNIRQGIINAYNRNPSLRDRVSIASRLAWKEKRESFEAGVRKRAEKKLKECQSKTDLSCYLLGNKIMVKKVCEYCGEEFGQNWPKREVSFCSIQCWNKHLANMRRGIPRSQFVYSNHKVVSVEFSGYEDVYNGTVDDFHNYFIGGFGEEKSEFFVNTMQCGESPLLSWESCNLGSLNISKFINSNGIDYKRLDEAVRVAVRFLDDMVDANVYPRIQIKRKSLLTRKIGLGVMGWADALGMLGIQYDTDEAIGLADDLMRVIKESSHSESKKIGKEKGYCFKKLKRRNACVTTIAPTGTLSVIAGCSSGIEPHFARSYTKQVVNGKLLNFNVPFNAKVSTEIAPEWHVKMQAAFQKYTDQAVSKTINLPNDASTEDVKNASIIGYQLGCKGLTFYRQGTRDAPMQLSECQGDKCLI